MAKKIYGIKMIRDDEYEVFSTHASMVPTLIKGIPFLLVGILVTVLAHLWRHDAQTTAIVGGVALAIVILSRLPGCIHAAIEPIVVSNRRLYLRKGIIDIDDHIASLANISDIQVDPTILGRMFGYADVNIQTIAGEQDFEMRNVRKAYSLRDHILRISDESSGTGMMYGRNMGTQQEMQTDRQYSQRQYQQQYPRQDQPRRDDGQRRGRR